MLITSALLCAVAGLGDFDAPTAAWPLAPTSDGDLTAQPAELAALDGLLTARIDDAHVPGFEGRSLVLERLAAATDDAVLFVDGEAVGAVGRNLRGDLSLWRGTVDGAPDSDVYLALSSVGARGWVRAEGRLVHLVAEPDSVEGWRASRSRWIADEQIRHLAPPPACEMLELPDRPVPVHAPAPRGPLPIGTGVELYQCRVAVETDWDYYQLFGDLVAAEAYALSLFGAVSDTYTDELGTLVHVASLGLYTSDSDPWSTPENGGGSVDMLYEFQGAWTNGWPVEADLAHLISGAGLGGGVAWVGVLGYSDYAYSVSGNLAGQTPFPLAQGPLNWDFVVTAHETGHNFGTGHTHNYCPPLDECAPEDYWGSCQDETLCVEGTIMSYCHLCEGGIANIRPEFHPTVVGVLRDSIESSALRPYEGLSQTDLGAQLAGSTAPTAIGTYDADANALGVDFGGLPAGSSGVAVIGASIGNLPLFGGTVVPSPDVLSIFPTVGGSATFGPADLSGTFYPLGVGLFVQGWFADPGAPEGFAASNALALDLIKPAPPADPTWVAHPDNGLEYAIGEPATWWHSRSLAEQLGGTLATVDSASLETWIVDNLFAGSGPNEDLWLGLTDALNEGGFYWVDGSSGTGGGSGTPFEPWTSGEPNDFNGSEDYAEWWQGGAGWNDGNGFDVQRALYQRPIGTTP